MQGGPRRSSGRLLAVVAAALVVGGCTGESTPDDDAPDASEELDAYLDVIFAVDPGAPDPDAVRFEEALGDCMAQAGFEYVPDRTAGMGFTEAVGHEGAFVDAEVTGYGMSLEGPDGAEPQFWGGRREPSEALQANEAYRTGLSAEAQVQYSLAMDGDFSEHSAVFDQVMAGEIEYDPMRAGCAGRAREEVYPDGMAGPAELTEVKEAVSTMWQELQDDGRVTQTLPAWSACLQDAGYPAMTQIIDAVNYVGELWEPWQETYANQTPGNVGVTDYEVVKEAIPDALRELQEAELDLAVADATCRAESGYVDAFTEAEDAIAQEILDTYRADLDTWAAWAAAQQAK